MAELRASLKQLHNFVISNADLIPITHWGFDQQAHELIKSKKHTAVNEKLTRQEKVKLSKKQKQQIARGVHGAVPRKVSEVYQLLSGTSIRPKAIQSRPPGSSQKQATADQPKQELDPHIKEILTRKGVKRRATASISDNMAESSGEPNPDGKVKPKKEKRVLTLKERHELKIKRKESRKLNNQKANAQKAAKNAQAKEETAANVVKDEGEKPAVKGGKENLELAFSKLDFVIKDKKAPTKQEKRKTLAGRDYKSLSSKLQKREEYVAKLKEKNPEKAAIVEQNIKWDTVISRAAGQKVKDNPQLLAKAQKRKDQLKNRKKAQWEGRTEKVEQDKAKRQQKRQDNIAKRHDTKVQKKLERMRKKGRLV